MAEFFSFGTNDLTQMTFGFSRDDVEGRIMTPYLEKKLLPANPFETLDQEGVGELVRWAASRAAGARANLKLGICGEHGGDPASVHFCHEVGSTTCPARRTGCRWPGSPPPTPPWERAVRAAPPDRDGVFPEQND